MAHGAAAKHVARCDQKHILESIYKVTTQHYSQAVELLAHNGDGPTGEDYKLLLNLVEEARASSEQARVALLTHIEEHGCLA
jgi:hypothetical protein